MYELAGAFLLSSIRNEELVDEAVGHYQSAFWRVISARYYMRERDGDLSKIADSHRPEDGRARTVYGNPGFGELVRQLVSLRKRGFRRCGGRSLRGRLPEVSTRLKSSVEAFRVKPHK